MMGNKPYPAGPTELDLRQNREELPASSIANQKTALSPKADTD